jgi:hypothetical protein
MRVILVEEHLETHWRSWRNRDGEGGMIDFFTLEQ